MEHEFKPQEVRGRTLFLGEKVWDKDNLVEVIKVEGAWPDHSYTLREEGSGYEYSLSNKWALREADSSHQTPTVNEMRNGNRQ